MKSLTFIGLILLALSGLLFYLTTDFAIEKFSLSHFMGIMGGIGIGLIIGGLVGYASKGSAIRAEQKRQKIQQLVKDKEALEKQAAELALLNEQALKNEARMQNDIDRPQKTNPRHFF